MRRFYSLCALACLAAACKTPGPSSQLRDAEAGGDQTNSSLVQEQPGMAPSISFDKIIERAKARAYWPGLGGDWQTDAAQTMASADCAAFATYMFPPANADAKTAAAKGIKLADLKEEDEALRTDGALVVKGGKIVYEHYVGAYENHPERLHPMWSASKSFTAALTGAVAELSERAAAGDAVAGGKLLKNGKAFGLDTAIGDLFDATALNADPRFSQLTVAQLLNMSPNLRWFETYEADIKTSDITRMLWLEGLGDMTAYAASKPFGPEGVSGKFNYSSGNAVMVMRALKDLYPDDYDRMPWTVFFDRIGMKSVVFERDQKGIFVGSSYVHTTLRDMAKLGYLYLNGGYYGKEQILQPDFFKQARVLSPSMIAPGTSEENITEEGAYYSLGWWINPDAQDLKGVRTIAKKEKFFPNSPNDVIFAAGHYGQNILIFPQEDLLVVRMSHDSEYFSKLDNMMSKARRCFVSGQTH